MDICGAGKYSPSKMLELVIGFCRPRSAIPLAHCPLTIDYNALESKVVPGLIPDGARIWYGGAIETWVGSELRS